MRRTVLHLLAAAAGALAALALATLPATASSGNPGEGSCPSSNPPNEMNLIQGSPQSATLGSAFATNMQVALTNSNGCAVTGVAGRQVTFTAPASGPSGTFSGSGSAAITVGANAQGDATAPTLSANQIAGNYTVTAVSSYGSVSFSLTNSESGLPAQLIPVSPRESSASITGRYAKPLEVRVLDAGGTPVAGVSVSFTITAASGTNACGATQSAAATFGTGATQVSATTNTEGIATSPPLSANASTGTFAASATLSGSSLPAPAAVSFSLRNLPGKPHKLTAGVGASQSASLGERFPIRLAVSVTDMQDNPVPGVLVTFTAPSRGASGSFSRHGHRVSVRSNACGIAIAPLFRANLSTGGYAVRASLAHLRAAFGLVNRGT
jgi:protocatechuate 3,4-dioxygenase beta subunit